MNRAAPARIALPLLLTLLAAGGIAYGWPGRPQGPPAHPMPIPEAPMPETQAASSLPPLQDLRATVQRPLFEPSRRMPAAAPPAPPAGPVVLGKYRLLGIVSAGGKRSAVLAPLAGGSSRLLAAGSRLEDWLLAEVNESGLVLRRGDASETVRLRPAAK